MSTTTLRLPPEVRARIDKLAASAGKTTHAFMVETLDESTARLVEQQAFEAEAQRRWARYLRDGKHYSLEDMRGYALALARGEKPQRPAPRVKPAEELALIRASARQRGRT